MREPFLSVAVITYNQTNYIAQTLDSIIEQRHNYLYEIIVGEDYSTDGTRDILLKYKERYPDIIKLILNESNLGLIKNYFNVISQCSGKYIMQCAGDDYWLPGKVSTQITFMEDNPDVGLCCGGIQRLHTNGKKDVKIYQKGLVSIEKIIDSIKSSIERNNLSKISRAVLIRK
jgi:glycosyltransferase involved in cell wall biosynthesis